MRSALVLAPLVAAAVLAAPAAHAGDGRWIHVRVQEQGSDGARVDLQFPVTMVSALLPAMKAHLDVGGSLDFEGHDVDLQQARAAWDAVKRADDGQYVTMRDGDDDVRVAKHGGIVHLDVDERAGGKVRVRVPVGVVDAVLGGKDTLDFEALGRALQQAPSGDMVTVEDGGDHVRIWIDDRPAASDERAR